MGDLSAMAFLLSLSLMASDLGQTAHFTARGYKEANPLVKDLVEPRSGAGEVCLAIGGAMILITAENLARAYPALPWIAKSLYIVGHGTAVRHNYNADHKDYVVVGPVVFVVRF
jgi:hypothetical protein